MKPLLQYGPAGRQSGPWGQGSTTEPCANESAERDARIREGIGMKKSKTDDVIPMMFASYGNGPFLMPSLQYPF